MSTLLHSFGKADFHDAVVACMFMWTYAQLSFRFSIANRVQGLESNRATRSKCRGQPGLKWVISLGCCVSNNCRPKEPTNFNRNWILGGKIKAWLWSELCCHKLCPWGAVKQGEVLEWMWRERQAGHPWFSNSMETPPCWPDTTVNTVPGGPYHLLNSQKT